jgi:hypothetical protein
MLTFRRKRPPRPDERLTILDAHARTLAVCEACAVTTRDLAAEVKRGGIPKAADLQQTIDEAERVLADLAAVRAEVERLRGQLR